MKRRIGLWALIGFAVACGWVILGLVMGPEYNLGRSTVVAITVPVSILGRTMPLTYYSVILLNAATYALFGLAQEPFWPHQRNIS
ncbi:MAG: hypothetical protein WBE76_03685 [Terracidiphilus sp.]